MIFLKTDIEKYFVAEKQSSLALLLAGMIALCLGAFYMTLYTSPFHKGLAIPLLALGFVQTVAGYAVYSRSDGQRIRNVYARDMNPTQLKSEELPRMFKVQRNFALHRRVEWALLVFSLVALAVGSGGRRDLWLGIGIALAIEAVWMLAADHFAERRADDYTRKLDAFTKEL